MKYKISDVCIINASSLSRADNLKEILYLDTSSITENTISELQNVILSEAPSRAQRKVSNNTIVYSSVRPRLCHYGIIQNPPENLIVSTGFITLDVIDENIIDPHYLYFRLTDNSITNYIGNIADTNVSSYPSINPSDLANLIIDFPSIEEQRRVGNLLSDIDRKIALNKSINCDLEAMAKQLYDYWFVQFDFPNAEGKPYKSSGGKMVWNETLKREIPEGWEVNHLNKWMDIKSGFAFKSSDYKENSKYKVVTIKNVQENKLDTSNCDMIDFIPSKMKDWCKLSKGNRLISLTGNCGRLCIVSENNLLLNQRVGLLDCNKEYLEFVYGSLQSKELQSKIQYLSNGAAQENLSPIDLCNLYWFMPVKVIISKFETILRNIRLLQISKEVETKSLVQQRDTLLPLLMNGQIEVKEK